MHALAILMGQPAEQFKERLKRGPQTYHVGFIAGFLVCLAIAVFIAVYFVGILENYPAIAGVIVAGISACILLFGIKTPNLDPIFEEIKYSILRVVQDAGPLPPIQVARKLDFPDETILDAIRFLVEEGFLEKNPEGKVICSSSRADSKSGLSKV